MISILTVNTSPLIGYSSKYASAEDLIGKKLRIYYDENQLLLEWDGEPYYLEKRNELDKDMFSHIYILRAEDALSKFDFPITEYTFCNDEAISTSVMVLVDKKEDVYVRFNDAIGDLAVFSLTQELNE